MDSTEMTSSDQSPRRDTAPSFAARFKPRLSARAQYVLAGTVWFAAAVALGVRGLAWVIAGDWSALLLAAGVLLGLLKARFIMQRVAVRAIDRIRERNRDKCAGGFFSWQSWLVVLIMMAGGHALRLTPMSRPMLGTLYVAIATGLLVAGRLYWDAALKAPTADPPSR